MSGGGWSHGGGGWNNGGGWSHGGGSWGRGGGWGHGNGFHGHTVFVGVPVFTGFGMGFGWGWCAFNPWWCGGPWWWGAGPTTTVFVNSSGTPVAGPPQDATQSQAPAACGSWVWDTDKQAYHWVPC